MKGFKKFLVVQVCLLLISLIFVGCGGSSKSRNSSNNPQVTPSPSVSIPEPRAWWKFEEGTIPLADSGTPVGNPVTLRRNSNTQQDELGAAGRVGYGVHFIDGYALLRNEAVNESPEVQALTFSDAMTAEAWIKLDDLVSNYAATPTGAGFAYLIYKTGKSAGYLVKINQNNTVTFQINNTEVTSTVVLDSVDRWYHILGTYDGNNIKIYIDGYLAGSTPYSLPIAANTSYIKLGGVTTSTSNAISGFKGYMDEVRLYDVALTDKQVEARYMEISNTPVVIPSPMPTPTPPEFVYPTVPSDLQYLHDVEIGTGGGKTLKLEICFPKEAPATTWPALVYIHGGGWNHGSKDDHANKIVGYAKKGYVGVAVQYRLTTESNGVFPAQLEDVKLAIRYLRAKASQYHINPDKIGVWGTSAGAHLASLLGTVPSGTFEGNGGWESYSSRVQAVVDHYGPADFTTEFAGSYSSITALLGVNALSDPDKARSAMPGTYASSDDPPFLVMHGTADTTIPPQDSKTFKDQLLAAGVSVEYYEVEGAGHGFTDYPWTSDTTWAFLEKHLK